MPSQNHTAYGRHASRDSCDCDRNLLTALAASRSPPMGTGATYPKPAGRPARSRGRSRWHVKTTGSAQVHDVGCPTAPTRTVRFVAQRLKELPLPCRKSAPHPMPPPVRCRGQSSLTRRLELLRQRLYRFAAFSIGPRVVGFSICLRALTLLYAIARQAVCGVASQHGLSIYRRS